MFKLSVKARIGLALTVIAATLCLIPVLLTPGSTSVSFASRPLKELTVEPVTRADSDGVSVNKANAEELTAIRGIGPAIAERIIEERETNGMFFYAEDLLAVKGIGESKLDSIRNQIRIETDGGQ